jgi:hypothetical protein
VALTSTSEPEKLINSEPWLIKVANVLTSSQTDQQGSLPMIWYRLNEQKSNLGE